MERTKLSILIVNWNTAEKLDTCLKSLFAHTTGIAFEVIVFDNASSDHSLDVLAKYPQVKVIKSSENIGFGPGNNRAAEAARGDFLLLLNPDTEFQDNILPHLVDYLRSNPQQLLGVRLLLPNGTFQVSGGNFPGLKTMVFQQLARAVAKTPFPTLAGSLLKLGGVSHSGLFATSGLWDQRGISPVDWVSGAFLLLRREHFSAQGGFDESFTLFAEEIDLCRRLKSAGIQTIYYGEKEIRHHSGASLSAFRGHSVLLHYAGTLRYYQKHRSRIEVLCYRLLMATSFLILFAVQRVNSIFRSSAKKDRHQRTLTYSKLFRLFASGNPQITLPNIAVKKEGAHDK